MSGRRLVAMASVIVLASLAMAGLNSAAAPETVYITQGGHYAVSIYTYGNSNVWVNMTVITGSTVDVYIMTAAQYENSYPAGQGTPLSFSANSESVENVNSASIHFRTNYSNEYYGDVIYVVVDNRECALTPDDASPTGQVKVQLQVDYTSGYDFYDDFDFFPFLFCTLAPLITLIIIVAIVVFAVRKDQKSKYMPLPPPPQYPVQPPQSPEPPGAPKE